MLSRIRDREEAEERLRKKLEDEYKKQQEVAKRTSCRAALSLHVFKPAALAHIGCVLLVCVVRRGGDRDHIFVLGRVGAPSVNQGVLREHRL